MSHTESTLHTANQLLEENRFAEAVNCFRVFAKQSVPSGRQLSNLAVAEDQERLGFLRELSEAQPDNFDSCLVEVNELIRLGHPGIAFTKIEELLVRFTSEKERFLLHRSRLKAGRLSKRFDYWAMDFLFCWNADVRAISRFRPQLLREIVSVDEASSIDSLRDIAVAVDIPDVVRTLAESKLEQLKVLASCVDATSDTTEANE